MIFFMDGGDENQEKQTELVVVDPSAKHDRMVRLPEEQAPSKQYLKNSSANRAIRGAALLSK